MSSTASTLTAIWPMSSVGKKPLGISIASTMVAASVPAATMSTRKRRTRHQSRTRSYVCSIHWKKRSNHAV